MEKTDWKRIGWLTAATLVLGAIIGACAGLLTLLLYGVEYMMLGFIESEFIPGAFTVPPEMAEHIRGAEVILGQATVPRCHCASISYGDTMEITFAGTQAETDTERDFFRFLVRAGIPVRVESNR